MTEVLNAYSKGKHIYLRSLGWVTTEQLELMGAVIVPKPIEWQVGDYVRPLGSGQVFQWNANPGTFAAGGSQHTRDQVEDGLRRGTFERVKVVPYDD